jgi:hypothetical protein
MVVGSSTGLRIRSDVSTQCPSADCDGEMSPSGFCGGTGPTGNCRPSSVLDRRSSIVGPRSSPLDQPVPGWLVVVVVAWWLLCILVVVHCVLPVRPAVQRRYESTHYHLYHRDASSAGTTPRTTTATFPKRPVSQRGRFLTFFFAAPVCSMDTGVLFKYDSWQCSMVQ